MASPTVSIITPTWNRKDLLRDCMESVKNQTFSDWEHLIVDDGSDDGTSEMVAERSTEDPRFCYSRREGEKKGANPCRNQGIRQSRGEFIVFLDSDDLFAPDCLKDRVEFMKRNLDLDFSVFQTGFFEREIGDRHQQRREEIIGDDLLRFLSFEFPWVISGPIWRTEALKALGGFDESLLSMQDVDLHVRAITSGMKYLHIPTIDHHVRWQNDPMKVSLRHSRDQKFIAAASSTPLKFVGYLKDQGLLTWSRQRAILGLVFRNALHFANAKETRNAIAAWSKGSRQLEAPSLVYLAGIVLLQLAGVFPGHFTERLINRISGTFRFRIEPALVQSPDK